MVNSTNPRLGEKATYYSAICLETGEIEAMPVEQTCTAETTVAFLKQLRAKHREPLIVIWDNGPMHRGQEIRDYLTTPDLRLRLVALPAYSPDFNAGEAIRDWSVRMPPPTLASAPRLEPGRQSTTSSPAWPKERSKRHAAATPDSNPELMRRPPRLSMPMQISSRYHFGNLRWQLASVGQAMSMGASRT